MPPDTTAPHPTTQDLETTVFHGHPSTSSSVSPLPNSSSNSLHHDDVDNLSHLKFCCLVIGPSSPLQSCWPRGATSVETKCCGLEFFVLQNSCTHAPLERVIARADVVERVQRSDVGPLCVHSPPCVFRASWCDGVDSSRTFSASLGRQPLGQAYRRTFFFTAPGDHDQKLLALSCQRSVQTALPLSRISTKHVGLELHGWSLLRHLHARGRNCAWLGCGCPIP